MRSPRLAQSKRQPNQKDDLMADDAFFLRSDQDGEAEDDLVPMFRRNGPADAASSGFEIPEHGIEADPVLRFGEHLIEFVLGHRNAQLLLTNLLTKRRGTFLPSSAVCG
jgi:hypothetical protein